MRRLLPLLLLGFIPFAQAQTIPASVQLNWTLPTTNTDGSAIPSSGTLALSKVQVWLSTSTIPSTTTSAPTAEVTPVGVTTTQTLNVASGATVFARIKLCNGAGTCSGFTNEVSKIVTMPTPSVPTSVTISITIG